MTRSKKSARRPSPRGEKVGELIREEISRFLASGKLKDPRLSEQMVTITRVKMTADLSLASVYVTVYGTDADAAGVKEVLAGLTSAEPGIRRQLGALGLRYTPALRFFFDEALGESLRLEQVFREIQAPPAASPPGDEPADPSDDDA